MVVSSLAVRRRGAPLNSEGAADVAEGLVSSTVRACPEKEHAKDEVAFQRHFRFRKPRMVLSQAGPRYRVRLSSRLASPLVPTSKGRPGTKKATRLGRPRLAWLC